MSKPLSGPLCGQYIPPAMLITLDHISLKFVTNGEEQYGGFILWYNRIEGETFEKLKSILGPDSFVKYVEKSGIWTSGTSSVIPSGVTGNYVY